ncbi:MAG: hypothetical protein ABIU63_12035 [Chitinophagaceae bacterium]
MNITRNNYEEFFMLYADNELSAAARKEVEAFIAANTDLQQELALFQQFKLSPDEALVYAGKEALLMPEDGRVFITTSNYESFFVLYADDEMTNDEKAGVEDFVYHHPQLQAAFELLLQVKLQPDAGIVFDDKAILYRTEKDDRVVPFGWWRLAVAVMVLIVTGIYWLSKSGSTDAQLRFTKNTPAVTIPQPLPLYKKEEQKSVDTGSNEQLAKERMALNDNPKEVQEQQSKTPANTAVVKHRTPVNAGITTTATLHPQIENSIETTENPLTGSTIASVKKGSRKSTEINTDIAAAASKSVINHQLAYAVTYEKGQTTDNSAVAAVNDDKLEVLNTSVNTKNSLRGFFRKASRLIAKKTNLDDDSNKHNSILIGGFEIAVR